MSLAEIQKMKADAAIKAVNDFKETAVHNVFELTLGIPAIVLHDKFGFGHTRLDRFLDEVEALSRECDEGRLSLEDMRSALLDECGFDLHRKEKSKWK